jgi:hypothetical protein
VSARADLLGASTENSAAADTASTTFSAVALFAESAQGEESVFAQLAALAESQIAATLADSVFAGASQNIAQTEEASAADFVGSDATSAALFADSATGEDAYDTDVEFGTAALEQATVSDAIVGGRFYEALFIDGFGWGGGGWGAAPWGYSVSATAADLVEYVYFQHNFFESAATAADVFVADRLSPVVLDAEAATAADSFFPVYIASPRINEATVAQEAFGASVSFVSRVTENATGRDILGVQRLTPAFITESPTLSESLVGGLKYFRDVVVAGTVSDENSSLRTLPTRVTENVQTTEVMSNLADLNPVVNENVRITDVVPTNAFQFLSITENATGQTDFLPKNAINILVQPEGATATQTVSSLPEYQTVVSEAVQAMLLSTTSVSVLANIAENVDARATERAFMRALAAFSDGAAIVSANVSGDPLWTLILNAQTPDWGNISSAQDGGWVLVGDNQPGNWQNVSSTQNADWSVVDTEQSPEWENIDTF